MDNERPVGSVLEAECRSFTRYLIRREPTAYVTQKYLDAHEKSEIFAPRPDPFNRFLSKLSARHSSLAAVVDAYTSIFLREAEVRKKWVVLIAILESCTPTDSHFDRPDASSKVLVWSVMAVIGARFAFAFLLSLLFILPIHGLSTVLFERAKA